MATVSRLFQASFSATLLRSAALAMALIVQTSSAHSETIDLTCASTVEGPGNNIRLKIDTDRRIVMEIGLDGAFGKFNSPSYAATMSEQFITYKGPGAGNSDYLQEGVLDRIAGTYRRTMTHKKGSFAQTSNYACRRATQKF